MSLGGIEGLDERFAGLPVVLKLENLDRLTTSVVQALGNEIEQIDRGISDREKAIEALFADFKRQWPKEIALGYRSDLHQSSFRTVPRQIPVAGVDNSKWPASRKWINAELIATIQGDLTGDRDCFRHFGLRPPLS